MAEWFNSLRRRVHALLHRRQFEQDLQDEVAFHLAMREDTLRQASGGDAPTIARRKFGSVTKIREELRDTWRIAPRVASLIGDLGYAARTLRRSAGFATVVILTLGLGIGANTAFFTVVNAVLIRPLGYANADRLVSLEEGFPQARVTRLPFSALDFNDLRRYQQSFETLAAYRNIPLEISGDGTPERIAGAKVSPDLFYTLGVFPSLGRTFAAEDDRPGTDVAILSWGLWQRRFAANPSVLGQRILLDRQPYTIVGIMPAGFTFPRRGPQFNHEPADVWVPIGFTNREQLERGSMHANSVVARLKPGVSMAAVSAELDVLAERIAAAYPPVVRGAGFSPALHAQPFRESISGQLEAPLLMLLAAVGMVLLVACANVANLILSRVATRTREFAVRTALGASHARLIQLLLSEAILLSAAGGVLGVVIGYAAVKAAPAVLVRTVPGLHDLTLDIRVLAFTAAVGVATAVIFGLVPLPALDRRTPVNALRDEPSRATGGPRKLRIQHGFVVLTVTLACVLLVGAGLFIRSFATLIGTDVGFRPAQVLAVSTTLPRTFYATAASVRAFHASLSRTLAALPGVRSISLATDLPLASYDQRAFSIEGALPNSPQPATHLSWVEGPFFETLGITLERGRFFAADEHVENRRVVIVNDKLAARAWPGQDAVGKRLKWGAVESPAPWLTVVGVVHGVADGPLGTEPNIHAYEPFRQLPDYFLNGATNQFGRDLKAAMLAEGDPRLLASLVRQEVAKLDPALAIDSIQPMDDQVREVTAPQRFSSLLVTVFAAIALLLATIGLYGLLAFTTTERQKEIAVRVALGARRWAVIRMVVGQGARLVAIGLAAGLLCSLALTRTVAALLYQSNPYDLVAFALIPAVLVPSALVACALPAWRAARVEPIAALRAD